MRLCTKLTAAALLLCTNTAFAQTPSGATGAIAYDVPHTTIPFRIDDPGTKLPDITWGLDLAWIDEGNIHRGVNFAGAELFGIVRLSFQTTAAVQNGELNSSQKSTLNTRINLAKKYLPGVGINLNSDQEAGIDEWYHVYGSDKQVNTFAPRWAALIAATKAYAEQKGMKVLSVSPFNEPDYGEGQTWGWHQGSKAEMLEICRLLREDEAYAEAFRDVLLCGGNTLNNDYALPWYNYSKKYLDEGNTHQLAGSFDNFAKFYQQVKADGKVGVDDELHNTMECMVGSEYGLTKGIWWETCEHTRSQFMKASRGTRLGYGENRSKWTAASVYRHTDGRVEGFAGASERQANDTKFRFLALDHDVFYNGQGPTREYVMTLPGGTGYATDDQPNAETLVSIQGGEDIMPALPTTTTVCKIINRGSGKALSTAGNSASSGTQLSQQMPVKTNKTQHWNITPVDTRIGGDYCYYKITNYNSPSLLPDVLNWSLDDGAQIILYAGGFGKNERWTFEYAGDGWFYIRSQHSGLYMQVQPGTESQMKATGRTITQGFLTGEANQQWRLIPQNIAYNAVAPAAPTALTATPQPASVALAWTAPEDKDLSSYTIQRSDDGGATWRVINRGITATEYIDNTACDEADYLYRVLAQDESLNLSEPSATASARPTHEPAMVMNLTADADLTDATVNGNHAALYGTLTLAEGHTEQAIKLDGSENFLQLPATIALSRDLTFSAWINLQGGNAWQRIFDFGYDTDHYVFLTTKPNTINRMRLAIKNGSDEHYFNATSTHKLREWMHVAVTFSAEAITLYLNGEEAGSSTTIAERPADFRPMLNYVGRSQFTADPMLNALVDDVRIYNYALSPEQIAEINAGTDDVATTREAASRRTSIIDLSGRQIVSGNSPSRPLSRGIYIIDGRKVTIQ